MAAVTKVQAGPPVGFQGSPKKPPTPALIPRSRVLYSRRPGRARLPGSSLQGVDAGGQRIGVQVQVALH